MTKLALSFAACLLALFVGLHFWALSLPPPAATARPLDRAKFSLTQQASVRADLKDPDAATFRNLSVSLMRRVPVLCGEVNEKTVAGGYGGYQRFIAGPMVREYERDVGRLAMDRLWQALCDVDTPVRAP